MILLTIIVGTCAAGLAMLYIEDRVNIKKSNTYGLTTKIKYKQIAQFYWVNPSKWKFEKVKKQGYNSAYTIGKVLLYDPSGEFCKGEFGLRSSPDLIRIKLSWFDSIRFFFARYSRKANYGSMGMQALLKSVQKDIDALNELGKTQIDEANREMKQIVDRLQSDITLQLEG